MRIFPIFAAIFVAVALYFVIIDRERLMGFFAGDDVAEAEVETDAGQAENAEDSATIANDMGAQETEDLIKVVAVRSVARQIDSAVVLRGQTEAKRQVEVRAETASTVISEPLQKGSFVEAGQLLCELDPGTRGASLAEARARLNEWRARATEAEARVPEAEARVTEAQARLDEALVNQNAAIKLSEGGFASETRVKNADAAVAAAKAQLTAAQSGVSAAKAGIQSVGANIEGVQANIAAAEKEISRLSIKAPFAGLLESDTAELGSLLQPGSLCATVIQLDPIKLVAFVPETDVHRVKVGARASGRLAAADLEVTGRVTFLSRAADMTTRTFRVEIEIPNPDLSISDGQTAEIMIEAEGANAHLLPQSALTLNSTGTLGLRTLTPDAVVEFIPAKLLRDTAQGVWLTGLPETADVIVLGQEYVTAGVKVAPTFREVTQ